MTKIKIIQGFESIKPPERWEDIPIGTAFLGRYSSDREVSLRTKLSYSAYINLTHGLTNFRLLSKGEQNTALFHDYEEVDLEIKIIRKR